MHIRDFGILRDQTLDGLHSGLVVIGGLNRAGKSTLMHVLRYLGYGFPRSGNLPPATVQYEVEADIRQENALFSLRLSGHGAPTVNRISGSGADVNEAAMLYRLDGFTYRQLFTITLEELQSIENLPAGERRRLQSVLLGAGLKEVAMLPQLRKEFDGNAYNIGRTRGTPSVGQFKKFYEGIAEGQVIKNRGLSHVKVYSENQARLKTIAAELTSASEELAQLRQQVRRLDLIKNHFENYTEMERLERGLKYSAGERWEHVPSPDQLERVNVLLAGCGSTRADIKEKEIALGLDAETSTSLLAKGGELASLLAGVSGIEERLRQFSEGEQRYVELERDLEDRIAGINANWPTDDLESICALRTDTIQRHRLEELVEKHHHLQTEYKDHVAQLAKLRAEQEAIGEDIQALEGDNPRFGLRGYITAILGTAVAGAIVGFFINPLVASLLGLTVILALTVYYFTGLRASMRTDELLARRREWLVERAAEIAVCESALAEIAAGQEKCSAQLEGYRELLSLEGQIPYSRLPGYLEQTKGLQDRILELNRLATELSRAKESLDAVFERYTDFLAKLSPQDPIQLTGDRQEQWALVFMTLGQWQAKLTKAEKIDVLQQKIKADQAEIQEIMEDCRFSAPGLDLEEEATAFVEQGGRAIEIAGLERKLAALKREIFGSLASDAMREAFGLEETDSVQAGETALEIFRSHCAPYATVEEAEQAHLTAVRERDETEGKLEALKDNKQAVLGELKRLSSQRDVEAGQRKVHYNRVELQRLAESYALHRAAAFLLQETEQNLLSGMKDSIMASAGKMFSRITGGEYAGIQPGEDLLEEDFQAVLIDNADPQTIEMLSRGTREQLYLSVRLSRILDVQPALPIIIDDSMANFDGPHLDQSLRILHEVAKTHQIFVLTCHGQLVEKLARLKGPTQYWKLERGEFAPSGHEELVEHLG